MGENGDVTQRFKIKIFNVGYIVCGRVIDIPIPIIVHVKVWVDKLLINPIVKAVIT